MNVELEDVVAGHVDRGAAPRLAVRRPRHLERSLGRRRRTRQRRIPEDEGQAIRGRAGRDRDVGEPVGWQRRGRRQGRAGGRSRRRRGRRARTRSASPRRSGVAEARRSAPGDGLAAATDSGWQSPTPHAAAIRATASDRRRSGAGRRRVAGVIVSSGDSGMSGRTRRPGLAPSHPGSCPAVRRPTPL